MNYGAILIVALLFGGLFTSGVISESNEGLATLANSLIPENNSNESNNSELNSPNNPANSEENNQAVSSDRAPENWETVNTDSEKNDDVITAGNTSSANINGDKKITPELFEATDEKSPPTLKSELGDNNQNINSPLLSPNFNYGDNLNGGKNTNTHPQKVPEPTSGFFSLAVAGLATAYLKKNKK